MGEYRLEYHAKWYQNRQAIETALRGNARHEHKRQFQSTPYSEPMLIRVSETTRMSEVYVSNITDINERRGSCEVDCWQHHHDSISRCESIGAVILEATEEQTTLLSDETNEDDCIDVPSPMDVLMGREKLGYSHPGNKRYQRFIDEHQSRYDACETRIEKTVLASMIAMKVKEYGGRFLLRKKGKTYWSEAAESVVSEKVTNAFRGRRKTALKRFKRSYDGTPPDAASKRLFSNLSQP
jgi:hypothetical protein